MFTLKSLVRFVLPTGVATGVVIQLNNHRNAEAAEKRPLHLLIAGAPGSGKGTQSANLVREYGVVHISTGDLLRDEVKLGSPAGLKAKSFMDAGALVPKELFFGILKSRLDRPDCKQRGWLLDGYPREKAQVDLMNENGLIPDLLIFIKVSDKTAIARVCGRRTDPVTGAIYHLVYNPPPNDPVILKRLEQRSDDNEEKALARMVTFHKSMDDAVKWYPPHKVVIVDGEKTEPEVWKDIQAAMKQFK